MNYPPIQQQVGITMMGVLSHGEDGFVRLHDTRAGDVHTRVTFRPENDRSWKMLGHHTPWAVSDSVRLTSDAVGTTCNDGSLHVWSLDSGEVLKRLSAEVGPLRPCALVRRARLVAAGCYSGFGPFDVVIFDLSSKGTTDSDSSEDSPPVKCLLHGHSSYVEAVDHSEVSPNVLFSISQDETLKFWDLTSEIVLRSVPLEEYPAGNCLTHDDETNLVFVGSGEKVKFVSMHDEEVAEFALDKAGSEEVGSVSSLTMIEDKRQIVVGSTTGDITVLDVRNPDCSVRRWKGYNVEDTPVLGQAYFADSGTFVSSCNPEDGVVSCWKLDGTKVWESVLPSIGHFVTPLFKGAE